MNKSLEVGLMALDPQTSSAVLARATSTPVAVGFPDVSKAGRTPNFQSEQSFVLLADAASLQQLIPHIDLMLGMIHAALGKTITLPVSSKVDEIHGTLSDFRSDLQGLYDGIEAELESRGVE